MKNLLLLIFLFFLSCKSYKATEYIYSKPVDTNTREIEFQEKKTYHADGVYADNQFAAARLNGFSQIQGDTFQAVIAPENKPINSSPWYAFKLWSVETKTIYLQLHYEHSKHRYAPVVSTDGKNWTELDTMLIAKMDTADVLLQLQISEADTLWLAAQELVPTDKVHRWCNEQALHSSVEYSSIGKSLLGRDLLFLDINEGITKKKEIIIILSRQHPPEVTGYFAMQAFVEEILTDTPLANAFRKKYHLLIFPLMNPDGVDLGHWRHNAGGIDLNRDWAHYRQPETSIVANYIVRLARKNKADVILGLDFHSTYYDIFYTNEQASLKLPGFKDFWIDGIKNTIGDKATVRPSKANSPVSKNWFLNQFQAEGLTYEIGDDTPREFIRQKGKSSAIEMMQLLVYK